MYSRIQALYCSRANGRQSAFLSEAFLEAPICQLSLCICDSCVTWPILVRWKARDALRSCIAPHVKIKFLVNLGKKETRVFIASNAGDFYIVALWSEFPCKVILGIETPSPLLSILILAK